MEYQTKNLKDIPNVEDVAKKIWREILDSKVLAPYIEDWARERLEKEIGIDGNFAEHREIEFKTKFKDFTLNCNVSLLSNMWKWDGEIFIDENTGDLYSVYNDFEFNITWSSYSSMPEDVAAEALKVMNEVFGWVRILVSPYRNTQTKYLQCTKEQEEKRQVENAVNNLRNLVRIDLPELTKGMRVKGITSSYYPDNDKLTTGKFEFTIKKKKFECSFGHAIDRDSIKVVVKRVE